MDAPNKVNEFKGIVSVIFSAVTALIGWQGWLVVIWVFAMLLDYITGSRAAIIKGEWSSKVAREGLWHKGGSIAISLVAAMFDLTIQVIAQSGMGFTLPWHGAIIFPVVVTWYILTEFGSIIENGAEVGAPFPSWLLDKIKFFKDKLDEKESKDTGWETDHSASEDRDEDEPKG